MVINIFTVANIKSFSNPSCTPAEWTLTCIVPLGVMGKPMPPVQRPKQRRPGVRGALGKTVLEAKYGPEREGSRGFCLQESIVC